METKIICPNCKKIMCYTRPDGVTQLRAKTLLIFKQRVAGICKSCGSEVQIPIAKILA